MDVPAPEVLHLDNHLLVIAKPPGMLSQADQTGDLDVVSWGKAYLKARFEKPGNVFLGLVHRLDRPASGVMVLARTSKAARRLTEQFRDRLPEKRYLAILEGHLDGWGHWTDYLVKEGQQVRVVEAAHPGAKRAELRWQVVAQEGDATLADVRLLTGRAHQIRVQFAHRGVPLLGDVRYGAQEELDGRNLALHAYQLRVEHPTKRSMMTFSALPPATWGSRFALAIAQVTSD
jgi:RluA family pseudouridine synthase